MNSKIEFQIRGVALGMAVGGAVASSGAFIGGAYVFKKSFDGMMEETKEIIGGLEDEYTPCTVEQQAEIDEVKDWTLKNYIQIEATFYALCKKNRDGNCNLTSDELDDIGGQILKEFNRTQVFCPPVNGDCEYDTFGATIRNADEVRPGQMTIYPLAFDMGRCQVAGTFMHELGHIATGAKHDPDNQDDWVYLFGDVVIASWKLDHGNCD